MLAIAETALGAYVGFKVGEKPKLEEVIKAMFEESPITGNDDMEGLKAVESIAARRVAQDLLNQSVPGMKGKINVVLEAWGNGKTCAMHIAARAKRKYKPNFFLAVCSKPGSCGNDWYDSVAANLEAEGETPQKLVKAIQKAVKMVAVADVDKKFSIDIPGFGDGLTEGRNHDNRPVLIFEDFNQQELRNDLPYDNAKGRDEIINNDMKTLGKSYVFLDELAGMVNSGQIAVFVSTKYKRVANVIQSINGGAKAKISNSVLKKDILGGFVDLSQQFCGFGWTVDSRRHLFQKRFVHCDAKTIDAYAEDMNLGVREACLALEKRENLFAAVSNMSLGRQSSSASSSTRQISSVSGSTGNTQSKDGVSVDANAGVE